MWTGDINATEAKNRWPEIVKDGTFDFHVPWEWRPVVEDLMNELVALKGLSKGGDFFVAQVKNKLGNLRCYIDHTGEDPLLKKATGYAIKIAQSSISSMNNQRFSYGMGSRFIYY